MTGGWSRKFDAGKPRRLQQPGEVSSVDLAVTQDWRDRVAKNVMAALDSHDLESDLPQGCDDLSPRDPRKAGHATVIFWTPMKSTGSTS